MPQARQLGALPPDRGYPVRHGNGPGQALQLTDRIRTQVMHLAPIIDHE